MVLKLTIDWDGYRAMTKCFGKRNAICIVSLYFGYILLVVGYIYQIFLADLVNNKLAHAIKNLV